ncbi:helix-turn-helix domain-containing protein [Paraburkholderia youngii]|uniref:helix-turn-helix domain-containing protein n=1 Tax=Paraburkholderia youngii TaxID=2782701 RepID=UPI0020D108F4|nr:helix-turn-helix domain-containing protein [Paraburkholderia youngii]
MLRRVSVEKASVTQISDEYGVSRPTFYQARADFEEGGIAGLVPRKRGPRGPHKIQGDVLAFLKSQFTPGEPIRARELAKLVRKEFGLDVHPRTIERAFGVKKRRNSTNRCLAVGSFICNRCAIRGAALRRAWRGLARRGPPRTQRLSCSRHVGMGTHDGSRACSAGSDRYPVLFVHTVLRAPERHLCTRRHGYGAQ